MKTSPVIRLICLLIAGSLLACSKTLAETVTLHPVADTALFENSPDNNLGGLGFLPLGVTSIGTQSHLLLRFDVSSIPDNATINSARLSLTSTMGGSATPATMDLFRMRVEWTEGTGTGGGAGTGALGRTGQSGESTWNERMTASTAWGQPGTQEGSDHASLSSGSFEMSLPSTYPVTDGGLAADIELWLDDPASNFGWIVKQLAESGGTLANGTASRFASRESPSQMPSLVIDYSVSIPPEPPELTGLQIVNGMLEFQFTAEANRTYTIQSRSDLTSGNWLPDGTEGPFESAQSVTVTRPVSPEPPAQFFQLAVE